MTTETINEIVTAAKIFARDFHTAKRFAGFTETEVMKGVAAYCIALSEVTEARETGRRMMDPEEMFRLQESAIGINDNNWDRVLAVGDKLTDIIKAARMLEHQDGGCAVSA